MAEAADQSRRNLLRKELAWLRRGPPARTSKPKFRIEAATALIEDEPAPRDSVELSRLVAARLGKTVIEIEDASVRAGERVLLDDVTWRLGPGERLLDRLGLRGDGQWVPVAELSGGERRRLQLMLVLLAEPNVLLLDEPTNDLDIDTLTELEDMLDGWPGSIVVVSHDRYFLERVTDHVVALLGGTLAYLPGGVAEYLERIDQQRAPAAAPFPAATAQASPP